MSRIPRSATLLLWCGLMLVGTSQLRAQTVASTQHAQAQMWYQHLHHMHTLYHHWFAQQYAHHQQAMHHHAAAQQHHPFANQTAQNQPTSPTATSGTLVQPVSTQTTQLSPQYPTKTGQSTQHRSPASRYHVHHQTANQLANESSGDPSSTGQQCQKQQSLLVREQVTSTTLIIANVGQQDPKQNQNLSSTKQQCLQQQSLLNRQDPISTQRTTTTPQSQQLTQATTTQPTPTTQQYQQPIQTTRSQPVLQYGQPTPTTQQYQQPIQTTQTQPTQQFGLPVSSSQQYQQPTQTQSTQQVVSSSLPTSPSSQQPTGLTGQNCTQPQGSPLYYDSVTKNMLRYMQMGAYTYLRIVNTQEVKEIFGAAQPGSSTSQQQTYVPQQTTQN